MTGSTLDLQSRLASVLDTLEASAKSARQFAAEQMPLLVQEILRFGFWINTIRLVILFAAAVFVFRVALYHFRGAQLKESKKEAEPYVPFVFATMFGYVPTLLFLFIAIIANLYNVLMITLAPRLYLIQYVADLLHK